MNLIKYINEVPFFFFIKLSLFYFYFFFASYYLRFNSLKILQSLDYKHHSMNFFIGNNAKILKKNQNQNNNNNYLRII